MKLATVITGLQVSGGSGEIIVEGLTDEERAILAEAQEYLKMRIEVAGRRAELTPDQRNAEAAIFELNFNGTNRTPMRRALKGVETLLEERGFETGRMRSYTTSPRIGSRR